STGPPDPPTPRRPGRPRSGPTSHSGRRGPACRSSGWAGPSSTRSKGGCDPMEHTPSPLKLRPAAEAKLAADPGLVADLQTATSNPSATKRMFARVRLADAGVIEPDAGGPAHAQPEVPEAVTRGYARSHRIDVMAGTTPPRPSV